MRERIATEASARVPTCRVLPVVACAAPPVSEALVHAVAAALAANEIVIVSCEGNRSARMNANMHESRRQLARIDEALRVTAAECGARVSRSATAGACAWAACRERPVGVDVQSPPDVLDDDMLAIALGTEERDWLLRQPQRAHAFATLWAAKEAVLKCFGVGLAWPPCQVDVTPRGALMWQQVTVPALGRAWLSYPRMEGGTTSIPLAVALNAGHR